MLLNESLICMPLLKWQVILFQDNFIFTASRSRVTQVFSAHLIFIMINYSRYLRSILNNFARDISSSGQYLRECSIFPEGMKISSMLNPILSASRITSE